MSSPPAAWSGIADAYERSFGRLCAGSIPALLDAIGPGRGRTLLDVGTGTGTVAEAATRSGFTVEAVDAEQTMIDVAHRHRGGSGVDFRVGSLPHLAYPRDAFDVATANFVINHTAQPTVSLREMGRVVTAGGPVVITIWPRRVSALNAIWTDVIERSRAVRSPVPRLDPSQDFDRTVDGVRRLMTGAGLRAPDVNEVTWDFTITPDDLWTAVPAGIAVIGTTYRAQDAPTRARMREAFLAATGPLLLGDELTLPMTCILGVGTAA